jgi:two-component system OmpR family response regulator
MPGKRILLIEDERDTRAFLALGLLSAGYDVDVAPTAVRASQYLEAKFYSLVLADWRLPDGNGIELADEAARLGAKTFIISGYLFSLPSGAADRHQLLMKPVRVDELVAAVRREIGEAGAANCA